MKKLFFQPLLWCIALMGLWISCVSDHEPQIAETETNLSGTDPLPSWNDGPLKQSIIAYVTQATDSKSERFIPLEDRIVVTDNDGTLWSEQPFPFELFYTFDYVKHHASEHPEWKQNPAVKALLAGDKKALMQTGEKGLLELFMLAHSGMSSDAFDSSVRSWIDTAHDARFHKLYKKNVYFPMLELLVYLRQNDFKTFIVSGGEADFMRVWAEEVYGIPPYQVVGTYNAFQYEWKDGKPHLTKLPKNVLFDDKENKPVAIRTFIGKQPVVCLGNSDGDLAMLQYTAASKYPSLCLLVHHTDSLREYRYDSLTASGRLNKALLEAQERKWEIVDMQKDWKIVFPFDKP